METRVIKVNVESDFEDKLAKAGEIIRLGGLVAFPTETVYGLGGDALNPDSSKKIYAAKGRPSDNPLIVHIYCIEDLYKIADDISENALKLADAFWPGPMTMVFKKKAIVPRETTGGLNTVAVRMPSDKIASVFIKKAGGFVAAPSANLSGRPSPTNADYVFEDMNGRIEMIIDGGASVIGLESTIIDVTEKVPMVLRPGYITGDMIKNVVGEVAYDPAVFSNLQENVKPKAPGMKYRHYAPKGDLTIIKGDGKAVVSYIKKACEEAIINGLKVGVIATKENVTCYSDAVYVYDVGMREDEDSIAHELYSVLRDCDDKNIDVIYSEEFNTPRIGQAIMNRLIKAAGHKIVEVGD